MKINKLKDIIFTINVRVASSAPFTPPETNKLNYEKKDFIIDC